MPLLQIEVVDSSYSVAEDVAAGESLTLIELLIKGGWIMVPIILLFFVAVYIFIERYITIRRAAKVDPNFMDKIQRLVENGEIKEARALCQNENSPISRMMDKALKKLGKPIDDIEKAFESAGKIEVFRLEKNLSILGTIAGIAPMFGFVGTIIGVIKIFYDISQSNDISINIIASGLYQKMVTSAGGLIVGILAHAGYHYLVLKIDKEIYKMESNSILFLDIIQEPTVV